MSAQEELKNFQCPDCKKNLKAKASLIPADGKKVKCPGCSHAFVLHLSDAIEEDEVTSTPSPDQSKQATTKRHPYVDVKEIQNRFIKQYRKLYIENVIKFADKRGHSIEFNSLGADYPGRLYDALFEHWPADPDKERVHSILMEAIRACLDAEPVLIGSWLKMGRDYMDVCLNHGGRTREMKRLNDRIFTFGALLYDAYFLFHREFSYTPPKIDQKDESYRLTLKKFGRYIKEPRSGKYLSTVTYFHGIPVEYDAEVIEANPPTVTVKVHPYQAVSMSQSPFALLDSPYHDGVLKASVDYVDLQNCLVSLSHTVPYSETVNRRQYIRVEPRENIGIDMQFNGHRLHGRLIDISIGDAAVYFRNIDIDKLSSASDVELLFELPDIDEEPTPLALKGTLIRIYETPKGDPRADRAVVTLEKNPAIETKLSRYINIRQSQILSVLRDKSDEACSDDEISFDD